MEKGVARHIINFYFTANGICPRFQRTVDFKVCILNGFHTVAADKTFNFNLSGDNIDKITALGDNRMPTNPILIPERISDSIHCAKSDPCRSQSVDSLLWNRPMAFLANVADEFCNKTHSSWSTGVDHIPTGCMLHNHCVNIVKQAEFNKLLFSTQKTDFSLFYQAAAVFQLHTFLAWYCHQSHIAVQLSHHSTFL